MPAAKELRIPGEAIHSSGRHGDTGQDGQWAEDKDDGKVGDLLQRVVAVESVELRRQVECRIVYPGIPGLQQHERRLWNEPPPLLRIEEHDDEEDARDDEPVDVEKMPRAGDADGMPVAGRGNDGRDVASIVLRGPEPIRRDLDRRQPNPFAARRAVIVEVEARMIDQDRQAASDQHRHKKKVEEVAVAYPQRKAMRTGEVIGIDLRDRRNMGEPNNKKFNPCRKHRQQHQHGGSDQEPRAGSRCGSGDQADNGRRRVPHQTKSLHVTQNTFMYLHNPAMADPFVDLARKRIKFRPRRAKKV